MFKKTFTALAIAAAIGLTGASAANADTYPAPPITIIINNPTIIIGDVTIITINGVGDYATIIFSTTGGGGTLSSAALANTASSSVTKTVANGSASTTFTAKAAGTYTVTAAAPDGTVLGSRTVTVTTAAASGSLPATGGEVPTIAIWGGVGAVALGGLAVAAVAARRRATTSSN
ncbi:LPXTG cell wall anchor domain-containing protein [Microbacterium sp. P01]|uniref:LPXTG cell wall anchor domain-containing protein n=1 Tax=unclassified Microbacterium TaxID=2609290 RepID=UPI0036720623